MAADNFSVVGNDSNFTDEIGAPPCDECSAVFVTSAILALMGCLVNSVIIVVYSYYKRDKQTTTELFIIFLAINDATYSLFVLVFGSLDFAGVNVESIPALSTVSHILHAAFQFLSWILYLNITFERFLCVCKPVLHQALYTRRRVSIIICVCVMSACAISFPFLIPHSDMKSRTYKGLFVYMVGMQSVMCSLNVVSMVTVYAMISRTLQQMHRKRVMNINAALACKMSELQSAVDAQTLGNSFNALDLRLSFNMGDCARSNPPGYLRECRRRTRELKMSVVMLSATVVFMLLVIPQLVANTLELLGLDVETLWSLSKVVSINLFNVHFAVNFFVYICVNEYFRSKICDFLRCRFEKKMQAGKMVRVSLESGGENCSNTSHKNRGAGQKTLSHNLPPRSSRLLPQPRLHINLSSHL